LKSSNIETINLNANTWANGIYQLPTIQDHTIFYVKFSIINPNTFVVYLDNWKIEEKGKVILQENHYYPYGKEIVSLGRKGSPNHEFTYNGKELSEEFNWNTYDYGARTLGEDFPVWNAVDRFAEKYYSISPYSYTAGNPIKYIDINGDSLGFRNTSEALINAFMNLIQNSFGGHASVRMENGKFAGLQKNEGSDKYFGEEGNQNAFDALNDVFSNENTVTVTLSENSKVDIGNFDREEFDIADMANLGNVTFDTKIGDASSVEYIKKNLSGDLVRGAIVHEVEEQYQRQVNGAVYKPAHREATRLENCTYKKDFTRYDSEGIKSISFRNNGLPRTWSYILKEKNNTVKGIEFKPGK
jgi:RHS repeat-associated protein